VVKIPAGAATQGLGSPTGQVAANGINWILPAPNGKVASFIFATHDGTISAWNSSVANSTAVIVVDNSAAGSVYTGLASSPTGTPLLFAANLHTGNIDVFDANFNQTTVSGGFADPNLPAGYAPFNIQNLGGKLYVTYALQNAAKTAETVGAGNGVVNIFDLNGNLLQRLVSNGGLLNAPWGVTIAPAGWGIFGGDVLVGNFGDGTINGYDPKTGNHIATMLNGTTSVGGGAPGPSIVNPGLWALQFGNGKSGGDPQTLYITSSVNVGDNKIHGLLAALAPPIQVTGIVNAAGYTGGSIAPGEIVRHGSVAAGHRNHPRRGNRRDYGRRHHGHLQRNARSGALLLGLGGQRDRPLRSFRIAERVRRGYVQGRGDVAALHHPGRRDCAGIVHHHRNRHRRSGRLQLRRYAQHRLEPGAAWIPGDHLRNR
jgi:uncharacterized protein (TIGR03118 family)